MKNSPEIAKGIEMGDTVPLSSTPPTRSYPTPLPHHLVFFYSQDIGDEIEIDDVLVERGT